eukprot:TRINITY_DN8381_c0_g1_i3.p1 TRINITY_DN8381_c0_g1~~TRINITY_DN8381_c0_g1_i3.p1  ORF type:complete len:548 (-),score=163.99 TRINITY_DN8381_c0_g1_i3:56-1699(-)
MEGEAGPSTQPTQPTQRDPPHLPAMSAPHTEEADFADFLRLKHQFECAQLRELARLRHTAAVSKAVDPLFLQQLQLVLGNSGARSGADTPDSDVSDASSAAWCLAQLFAEPSECDDTDTDCSAHAASAPPVSPAADPDAAAAHAAAAETAAELAVLAEQQCVSGASMALERSLSGLLQHRLRRLQPAAATPAVTPAVRRFAAAPISEPEVLARSRNTEVTQDVVALRQRGLVAQLLDGDFRTRLEAAIQNPPPSLQQQLQQQHRHHQHDQHHHHRASGTTAPPPPPPPPSSRPAGAPAARPPLVPTAPLPPRAPTRTAQPPRGAAVVLREDSSELGMELVQLMHQHAVSNVLHSTFRTTLEALIHERLEQIGGAPVAPRPRRASGSRAPAAPAAPPRIRAPAPFDGDMGMAAHALPTQHHGQYVNTSSVSMAAELAALQMQVAELRRLVSTSFELQLDLQRSIRQEVAGALNAHKHGLDAETMLTPPARMPSDDMCTVCCERTIDTVLYRCGHMVACTMCSASLLERHLPCPICRAPIVEFIRCFKA